MKKKNRQKTLKQRMTYFIAVITMIIITFSVVFFTSYNRPLNNTSSLPEERPAEVQLPEERPVEVQLPEEQSIGDEESESVEESNVELIELEEQQPPLKDSVLRISASYPDISFMLYQIATKYNCVGVSIAVFDGESRDYYIYQYGYRDLITERRVGVNTKFNVASLSKPVAVVSAMALVDEGKLDLDADISTYLGYAVRNPHFPETVITTRMLMQHTSSMFDADAYFRAKNRHLPETVEELLESGVLFGEYEPGTQYSYSAFVGYAILGLICEEISGKRFDDFAREVLFDPMGIDAAFNPNNLQDNENIATLYESNHKRFYTVEDQLDIGDERVSDNDLVSANLTISAIDYAKILVMLGNGGMFNDERVLSSVSVQEIYKTDVAGRAYRQGLAMRSQDYPGVPLMNYYWHVGGFRGALTHYSHFINDNANRGVVILTTGAETGALWNEMGVMGVEFAIMSLQTLN